MTKLYAPIRSNCTVQDNSFTTYHRQHFTECHKAPWPVVAKRLQVCISCSLFLLYVLFYNFSYYILLYYLPNLFTTLKNLCVAFLPFSFPRLLTRYVYILYNTYVKHGDLNPKRNYVLIFSLVASQMMTIYG